MIAGWLDSSVGEVVDTHRAQIAELSFCLIRSIDSTTGADVAEMPWAIARRSQDPGWALSLDPLVISGDSLVDLLRDYNLFTGFDEIWIPSNVPVTRPTDGVWLVAPRELGGVVPPDIAGWMHESGCLLGFGDGYGVNWVSSDVNLARVLGLSTL